MEGLYPIVRRKRRALIGGAKGVPPIMPLVESTVGQQDKQESEGVDLRSLVAAGSEAGKKGRKR